MIPKHATKELRDLLEKLLEKDPTKRLCDSKVIKKHPWFKNLDWEGMKHRKISPPYVPDIIAGLEKREEAIYSLKNIGEEEWKGFNFIAENY